MGQIGIRHGGAAQRAPEGGLLLHSDGTMTNVMSPIEVAEAYAAETAILEANHDAVLANLHQKTYKVAPFIADGEWRWAPDQIERYRRRKKYRKAYERRQKSGIRNPGKLVRPAGRLVRRSR